MANSIPTTIAGERSVSLMEIETTLDLSAPSWCELDLRSAEDIAGLGPKVPRWHDSFVLICSSYVEAWARLPLLRNMGKAHQVFVLIRGEPRPFPAAGPPTISQLGKGLACASTPGPDGYVSLQVRAGTWVDVYRAVAAALSHQTPGKTGVLLGGLRIGTTDPDYAAWMVGDTLSGLLSEESLNVDPGDISPVDVLISATGICVEAERGPGKILEIEESPSLDGWSTALPPVNTRFISPQGFEPYPTDGRMGVRWTEPGWINFVEDDDGAPIARMKSDEPLDESALALMRDRSYLDFSKVSANVNALQLSKFVSSAAVAGVPMLMPQTVRNCLLLSNDLVNALSAFSELDPNTVRESKSIHMRRIALRYFEPGQRWAHWTKDSNLAIATSAVSVVLATKRPGRVMEAIGQIDAQSWPEVEIVLALHGVNLSDAALRNIIKTTGRNVRVVNADANLMLGEVLNLGVEAASGDHIAKMDDDDWYGSHHLEDLMQASIYSGADLLGSQVEFVYLEDLDITTRRPPEGERYTDHVAGGTMLIARSLLKELGGWRPVHRAVDRCLLNAVEAAGGITYRGHGQNYMMHRHAHEGGHGGHTWSPETEVFLQNSIQQWDGFVLPPQIERSWQSEPTARSVKMRSIFS